MTDTRGASDADLLALVLPGGGARTAYQVGVLSGIAERFPKLSVPIYTGVSGGAINAAFLAAHPGSFGAAVADLEQLWLRLSPEQVFRLEATSLLATAMRWFGQLALAGNVGGSIRGMVDTAPLRDMLGRLFPVGVPTGITRNITLGRIRSVALTTTNYTTGQAETFVQGALPSPWQRPYRRSVAVTLTREHVLASAAIPLLFPAVRVGTGWHGDGGIRQTTPLSPAIHLGARRILAISNLREPSLSPRDSPSSEHYPSLSRIAGLLVNSLFIDNLDSDLANLQKLNRVIQSATASDGIRPVEAFILRPSGDIGKIAAEYEAILPGMLRHLSRGWGAAPSEPRDLLAALLFDGRFAERLITMGRRDSEAQLENLEKLLVSADA